VQNRFCDLKHIVPVPNIDLTLDTMYRLLLAGFSQRMGNNEVDFVNGMQDNLYAYELDRDYAENCLRIPRGQYSSAIKPTSKKSDIVEEISDLHKVPSTSIWFTTMVSTTQSI